MNRITQKMKELRSLEKKALALFLTAGYPRIDATVGLALELEEAGADIIEIGMPFSDPIADGPVIQRSSAVALGNGVTLEVILDMIRRFRGSSSIPMVLMGYMNPILRFGDERFFREAARAGADGIILPELPLEESPRVHEKVLAAGLAHIHLVTPTSPTNRIRMIDGITSGFLYCVSTTGVTGGTGPAASDEYLRRVTSAAVTNPVMVGFGVRTPGDAARYASAADGVIVGSALLERLQNGEPLERTKDWVRKLKSAMAAPAVGSA